MRKTIVFLLFFSIAFSCERDDICPESTPTTPRLVMDFLDILNTDNAKSVNGFRVEVEENTSLILPDYTGGTSSSAILPLKTTEDTTRYLLYKDYTEDSDGNPTGGNPDVVTITYARNEVYVSRACGFKTIFENVELTVEADADNWIQLIEPVNNNRTIEDETTTHFNLLH